MKTRMSAKEKLAADKKKLEEREAKIKRQEAVAFHKMEIVKLTGKGGKKK